MSKWSGILLALVTLFVAQPTTVQAQDYVVIVNGGNPATEISKANVSKMFLKQLRAWPAGGAVQPVDLDRAAAARAAFSTGVHGRALASIEEFWLQQVFAGKDEPPATLRDDAAVIAFVAANRGAIGYVSGSASLPGSVKRLTVAP